MSVIGGAVAGQFYNATLPHAIALMAGTDIITTIYENASVPGGNPILKLLPLLNRKRQYRYGGF